MVVFPYMLYTVATEILNRKAQLQVVKSKWHEVKEVRLKAIQHISASQTDNLMKCHLSVLPSDDKSPALCSFHFVSLYFSELKSHEQQQDSALTSGPFSPATPMTHAPTVAVRPREIWTGRGSCSLEVTKAKACWLTEWMNDYHG